jgi:death-on-curing family protein
MWCKILTDSIYSIEEQAANLLYFIIKNHPFSDGNKRIGAFMFVWFLEKNKHRFKANGELKINDNALVALALLVAQSNPSEKDLMLQLIINLIKKPANTCWVIRCIFNTSVTNRLFGIFF